MDLTTRVMKQYNPNSYGTILKSVIEKLASALVTKTNSYDAISITLQTLGMKSASVLYNTTPSIWYIIYIYINVSFLQSNFYSTHCSVFISFISEVQVFTVGPKAFLSEPTQFITSHASMAINLNGIREKNDGIVLTFPCLILPSHDFLNFIKRKKVHFNVTVPPGSAAVAFMSYTNMADMLDPTFYNTFTDTRKTIISRVVTATFPKTATTTLTGPVNFTLKHTKVSYLCFKVYCLVCFRIFLNEWLFWFGVAWWHSRPVLCFN